MKKEEIDKLAMPKGISLEILQTPVEPSAGENSTFNITATAKNIPGVKKAALLSALFNAALSQWCEICGATGFEEVYGGESMDKLTQLRTKTFGNPELLDVIKKDSN